MRTGKHTDDDDFVRMRERPRRVAAALLEELIERLWPRVLPHAPIRKYAGGAPFWAVRRRLLRRLWSRQAWDECKVAKRE